MIVARAGGQQHTHTSEGHRMTSTLNYWATTSASGQDGINTDNQWHMAVLLTVGNVNMICSSSSFIMLRTQIDMSGVERALSHPDAGLGD